LKGVSETTKSLHKKLELMMESEKEIEKQKTQRSQIEEMELEQKKLQEEKIKKEIEELEALIAQENNILEKRSRAIRQYLADLVAPILTEAIIRTCKEIPDDPIGFLVIYSFFLVIE